MKSSNIILVVLIVFLLLILLGLTCTSDSFTNMMMTYGYKLPVLGTVSNLQSSTVARMKIKYEEPSSSEEPSNSEEPLNSEEPSSSEEGWVKPMPDQSRLLKNLYHYERKNMRFGELKSVSDSVKVGELEEESLWYRLNNASNSMFIQ